MSNIYAFDRILKTECNCHISPKTADFRIWMTLKEMMQTRICGEQDF